MNKLNLLENYLGCLSQIEIPKSEIYRMITHYVQDGDYDLNDRGAVEDFMVTYCEEEGIKLVDDTCCRTITFTLSCRECRPDSMVIGILEEEETKQCECDAIWNLAQMKEMV